MESKDLELQLTLTTLRYMRMTKQSPKTKKMVSKNQFDNRDIKHKKKKCSKANGETVEH